MTKETVTTTETLRKKEKFKQIELSLDLLSHNFGPQSSDVEMARDYLNDGHIEEAYHSLSSTVHFYDLSREIEELKNQVLNKEKIND